MEPVILFRKNFETEEEFEIAKQYLPVVEHRTACKDNLVICRYSALPYYRELQYDLKNMNSKPINGYMHHRWIADFGYYTELQQFTPETWDDYTFPQAPEGEFVVKGRTNSRKFDWNKLMYAPNKREAMRISTELMKDGLIGEQGCIYRRYIPLKTYEIGLNDLPFTNEWRFFYLGETRLSYGYYWSSAEDPNLGSIDNAGLALADSIAKIAARYTNFFVLDLAEKAEGGWILIEVNDGQMSGISENDPNTLYGNLAKFLQDKEKLSALN